MDHESHYNEEWPRKTLECPHCNSVAITGTSKSLFSFIAPTMFVQCSSVVCGAKIESKISLADAVRKWNLRYKG